MSNSNFISANPRRIWFYSLIIVFFLFLVGGFYHLQIQQQDIYQEQSLKNSVKVETQVPVRGLIYDRNRTLIADNRPSFSVYVVPAEIKNREETVSFLGSVLGLDQQKILGKFRRARRFQPLKIARYVDPEALAILQENKRRLPGVEWRVEPRRNYKFDKAFAHVLGTLGEVTENELNGESQYEAGDVVGKKGIEKALDGYLRGHKGFSYIKVDALGRTVAKVTSEKNSDPYPGHDLYLTIDSRLQLYADSLFAENTGALIAVDVRTGEILTLLSKPDYDLNLFTEAVEVDVWNGLMSDAMKPLFDRAAQATYPPGSTYKMIAAIAALNENIVSPQWSVFCPGFFRIGRRTIRCWKAGGHGEVNLRAAIRGSCNVYFYQLGLKIGIDHWNYYSRLFDFGKSTNVELDSEKRGLVPSRAYYDRIYGDGRWTSGMLANIAIGQGELLVTPLQMAKFTMALANHGVWHQPHLTLRLYDKIKQQPIELKYETHKIKGIRPEIFEFINEGMFEVVQNGTGGRASIYGINGAGKTGTAQNPHGDSHAWYIGYAPYENPEIAIVVLLENAGSGGIFAAPIAGKYLRRYFYYHGKFDYQVEREYLNKMWLLQKERALRDSLKQAEEKVQPARTLPLREIP